MSPTLHTLPYHSNLTAPKGGGPRHPIFFLYPSLIYPTPAHSPPPPHQSSHDPIISRSARVLKAPSPLLSFPWSPCFVRMNPINRFLRSMNIPCAHLISSHQTQHLCSPSSHVWHNYSLCTLSAQVITTQWEYILQRSAVLSSVGT